MFTKDEMKLIPDVVEKRHWVIQENKEPFIKGEQENLVGLAKNEFCQEQVSKHQAFKKKNKIKQLMPELVQSPAGCQRAMNNFNVIRRNLLAAQETNALEQHSSGRCMGKRTDCFKIGLDAFTQNPFMMDLNV